MFLRIFITLLALLSFQSTLGQELPYHELNKTRDITNPDHTPEPSRWTQESRVGDTLFIDGEIQEIQWSFLEFGEYKGVRQIVLNSYGGLVRGAEDFARVIREQGITTVVPAGGVCMSACTLLFQAGLKRQAHESSLFMYHAPRAGHIGMARFERLCKEKGADYCEEKKVEFIAKAEGAALDFFQGFYQYGLNPRLKEIIFSLPEENESQWIKDGNWFKKVDLFFSPSPSHPFILDRKKEGPLALRSLEELEDFNVITEWFSTDPGWKVDPNIEGDLTPLPFKTKDSQGESSL